MIEAKAREGKCMTGFGAVRAAWHPQAGTLTLLLFLNTSVRVNVILHRNVKKMFQLVDAVLPGIVGRPFCSR